LADPVDVVATSAAVGAGAMVAAADVAIVAVGEAAATSRVVDEAVVEAIAAAVAETAVLLSAGAAEVSARRLRAETFHIEWRIPLSTRIPFL
jgi:hypothetical protein